MPNSPDFRKELTRLFQEAELRDLGAESTALGRRIGARLL